MYNGAWTEDDRDEEKTAYDTNLIAKNFNYLKKNN